MILDPTPYVRAQTWVVLQVLLIIAAISVGVWLLHRLAAVVLVSIVAALFAYVIAPLVQLAEHPIRIAGRARRLPRAGAIVLVYVVMAVCLSAGVILLLPGATQQANEIIARAPAYAQSIVTWEHGWSRYYDRLRIPPGLRLGIWNLPWLVLIPIQAFFLLKDAASFRRTTVIALPYRLRLRGHRLFVAVPAVAIATIVCRHWLEWRRGGSVADGPLLRVPAQGA